MDLPIPVGPEMMARGGGDGHLDHPIGVGSKGEWEQHRAAGAALMKSGDYAGAERRYAWMLGTAMSVDDYAVAHCNRAAARLRMGRHAAAEADAERAARLAPENAKAHYRHAEALRLLGRFAEALEACERVEALCPGDAAVAACAAACEEGLLEAEEKAAASEAAAETAVTGKAEESASLLPATCHVDAAAGKQDNCDNDENDGAADDDDSGDDDEVVDLTGREHLVHAEPPPPPPQSTAAVLTEAAAPPAAETEEGAANEEEEEDEEDEGSSDSDATSEERAIRREMLKMQRRLREIAREKKRKSAAAAKEAAAAAAAAAAATSTPSESASASSLLPPMYDTAIRLPRSSSPEVIMLAPDAPVSTVYGVLPRGAARPGASTTTTTAKPPPVDYSRFDRLCDDVSDDEAPEVAANHRTLDAASAGDRRLAAALFEHFDAAPRDGFWRHAEAAAATRALEDAELTEADYLDRCEAFGADPEEGWPLVAVQAMYLQSDAMREGLLRHTRVLNERRRRADGVVLREYHAGDTVDGYIDRLWRAGVVHAVREATAEEATAGVAEGACVYDVVWGEKGEGTRGVPASCLRSREAGYTGPTGLRGEGKAIAAGYALDARSGLATALDTGAEKGGQKGWGGGGFEEVGSELLENVPPRSDLPEDPVQRLGITVERTGMDDPTTGFLCKEKVRKMLGQRQRT